MSLNFSAFEGKNIFKFAKYEVKEIGKTKYIVPDSINKKHSSGAPLIDIEKDFAEVKLIKTGEYEYIYDKHYLEIQKDQVWLDRLCNHLIDTAKIKRYSSGYDNEWIKYYEKAGRVCNKHPGFPGAGDYFP